MPANFHYDEVVRLLGYFKYFEMKTGKTSGFSGSNHKYLTA